MAIRITQIRPEGAQKSAPSAKDYSGEKKASAGSAVSGGSGRIKITKLPEAEAPHTVAAGRKTTRETERADELDKLTRPSARRTEAADEADKQNPPRRTLETPAGSSLVRDMDGGALQQEMVRQLEEAAKNGLFQRTLPEERGSRHQSGKELSQKILRDTETAERIRSAAAGTAQGAAANTAGFLGALVAAAEKIDKQYRDEKERLGVTTHADEMNPYPRTNKEITRGNRAGVQLLEGIADTQRAKAQESTAQAKKGASALGSAGVDALQIGLNLAAIVGASAAAPGAGLLLMGTQSGGAAANDYRQYAAENGQEANPYAAAGLAIGGVASAGIGAAAAKGALKYGSALVNKLGLGNSKIAQYALGALSDAALSGGMSAANEYAKAAAYGDSYENVRTNGEDLAKDMLFQAAVGFLCRTLTSSFGQSTAAGQPERVQREYFKDIDSLDDLARAFKQYGRQYHPDRFATADAATQRQMSDIFARISAEYNAVKAELAIETAGRAAKSYGEKRGAKTPEAASAAGRTVENELMVLKRAVENGTLTGTDAAEAVQIMEAVQKSASDSPAAAQESAQGAPEGNLTPAPETGAEGALQAQKSSPAQGAGYSRQRAGGPVTPSGVSATQESKVTIAPAAGESKRNPLDAGKRVDLGRYADERNAQEISRGLNDGTLAVDADNRLYRVNEDEHIDRRSSVTVGQRSMNAFQFDHPELHQYFRDAAADLAEELSYAEKGGEIVHRTSHEAGDDEYFRTKRVASERIARLLDDERIGYDDIDRAVTALIHDEGQENFAAAKRVELLLDNMLTSGYTDIHGRYVAPNENYIAAKRAIRGADAGAQVREELPLWDMPEAQNRGGVYEKQQTQSTAGIEPAEAGGRRANAVGSDGDLYGGNGERRASEPGAGGTEKLRKDAERRDQELKRSRQRAAMMQPLTSAAALDVSGGTERALVHVLPEESWDDELHSVANFARRNGVQRVTMVTGALEVDTGSGIVPVNGCINYRSGEMVLRVDSAHHTATEIARHEIGHLVTEERNVRAFMQEVRRGDAWHELYDAYEKKYAALTRNYIGMTPEDRALYVWEEILEDAYAEMDNYGQQASTYHDAAVRAVDGADAESTPAREESERPQMRAVDAPKSRGPPERFSYAGKGAKSADLAALDDAQHYEMQGVDAETIRQKTGWFRGMDGKWRSEVNDSGMKLRFESALYDYDTELREKNRAWDKLTDHKLTDGQRRDLADYQRSTERDETDEALYEKLTGEFGDDFEKWALTLETMKEAAKSIPNYTTLGKLVDAPELFAAYPDLADVGVTFQTLERGQNGGYHRRFDSIELSRDLKNRPEELLDSLTHEVQHAIQSREGFTPGANPQYWNRKLEDGYDGRTAKARREGAQLREQYEQMKADDPEFMRSMEALNAMAPTVPRGKIDPNTWEQIEPDPPEWVRFDERRDQLEEKYGDRVWDYFSLRDSIDRNARDGRLPGQLYRDTAGEIEARDAAARRGLTVEERRSRKPNLGDEDTVFSDGSGWSSHSEQDGETSSIKEQIENNREKLNAMEVVARASAPANLANKDTAAQWAAERLRSSGYKIDRQGYGDIYFSKKDLDKGLRYADTPEEKAALAVLPQVLKRGIEIGEHANHKGRTKQTITFAAPVELNGTRGNMAVVVNKNGNHYYAHRIVLPDGTTFRFSKEESNAAQELSRGVTVSGSLADTTSAASKSSISKDSENVKPLTFWEEVRRQIMGEEEKASAASTSVGGITEGAKASGEVTPAINTAHDGSIADNSGNVKPKTRFSVEDETDSTGRELTVQQQEYFRDSKVRDEQGRLLTMYHGTNADKLFTVFDTYGGKFGLFGRGSYFTDNPEIAQSYTAKGRGNSPRTYEVYLNIKNPLDMDAAFDKSAWKDQPWDIRNAIARAATNEDVFRALKQYCEDEEMIRWEAEEFISDTIRSAGFDGITHIGGGRYGRKDGPRHRVFIAFDPEQIKNVSNETPTDAPDIRFSAEDEDGGEWDRELARMPQSVQEAVQRAAGRDNAGFRKEDFPNLAAYLSARDDRQAAEKAERLRDRSKDEFEGTEALEKLGVKIENSAGDYSNVRQLIENDKAAKQIQKETRKAIQRLGMTPKEQSFALNIASGLYVPSDIPRGMDRDKVLELADYYAAENAMTNDLIRARRSEINDRLQEKMEDLFDEKFEGEFTGRTQKKGIAPESGFALYHRTPQRSMRAIFGWDRGQKINEAIFEPVYVNEQERKRFVNRMHGEVRTFTDENGGESPLTRRERAITQLVIEGKAVEEMVAKSEIKQQIIHAAENLLGGAEMKDVAPEFGLHGEKERELAQRYADWLETKKELDSGEVDRVKIENSAAKYSGLYNEFYAAINDFLVAHGYEPIGFIKGYAPHFQPEAESGKLERALKTIGVDLGAEVGKLPASIAGLTKEFKPNKRYNPFFQHRNGTATDYDIQKGFEKYVDYLSDVLYHTDDIMRTRAASKYFRKKYAPDDISAQLEQAEQLRFATPEEKELFLKTNGIIDSGAKMSYQAMNQAMEKYTDSLFDDVTQTTKYGDLVTWLDDYANKLAGKQLFNDRSMEREVGRMSLNVGRKLVSTFARANVAGNLSSALNQTAQLPMIAGELGPKYVAAAIGDIAKGEVKGDFAARSDFLTEKHGIDYLTNTKGDKFTTALFWPLERMDYLVSSIAVRGKYRKELAEGKGEKDALRAADRWGRDMMGSRSKGTAPLTFQSKNLVSQMVNLFQVEALNSWEHVTQDLFGPGLREMEEKLGRKEASRRLAGIIIGTLLGAFILNRVDEELYGGTPAQFDALGLLTGFLASGNGLSTNEQLGVWIDDVWQKMTGERLFGTDEDAGNDRFNLAAAAEDTIYNVSNDVPYVRNVSGLLGLGDETLPMPDIYGTVKGIGGTISKQASGDFDSAGDFWSEVGRQLMGLAGDTVPGGRQVEKSAQGIEAVARGGSYKGSGDNKKLQYPVDVDPFEALRAALFGKNALPESRAYWAAGGNALSASQTRTYQELVDMGADREVVYEAIQKWRKIDKDDSLTDGEREAAQYELVRKLKLTNEQKERLHDELSRSSRSYAAVQEAQKQGISAEAYAKYKDATADLTADKDENGKTINGSKKAKVLDAIDKMQLSKKQKDWLYLDAGYSEKDIGKAPWH